MTKPLTMKSTSRLRGRIPQNSTPSGESLVALNAPETWKMWKRQTKMIAYAR
jgi:hypothetical protein